MKHWPTFLLRNIPPALLNQLLKEASERDDNVQDTIRHILCRHYRMNCPPVANRYAMPRGSSNTLLLRLQPKLKRALDRDAAETGLPLRTLIMDVLDAHYIEEEAA